MKLINFIFETTKGLQKYIVIMLFCTLVIAIDANLRPYLIKLMIDDISKSFNLDFFLKLALVFIVAQIIMSASNALRDWVGTKFHTRYRKKIAHHFLNHLSHYSYRFFQDTQTGSITSNITDAFNSIPMLIFMGTDLFIEFVLMTIVAMVLLANISSTFVILTFVWILVFLALTIIFYKKYEPLNADYAQCRPKIFGFFSDYFGNIRSVWSFNNTDSEKQRFEKITDEFVDKSTICGIFLRNYYAFYGFVLTLYMTIILYILGKLALKNQIQPGDFALVFMVNYKISDALFKIANQTRSFITSFGVAQEAIKLLDHRITIRNKQNSKKLKINKPEIKFSEVKFHYEKSKHIFHFDSVVIKAGQKVGLVGYSGSGKSSFINLIMRLYDIQEGNIFIDNQDIKNVTLESLRFNIGLIPQNPNLFHRTIMENIRYGKPNATDQEVFDAAKKANAHEFITALPKQYSTLVGDRGIKLSGGQRQRIAIARAILKNAPILVLDEATSQLDSINEKMIQKSLNDLMKGKTTIVIAHRLSTLLEMDRILVFDAGKIVEDGAHEKLLQKNGLYTKLWKSQLDGMIPADNKKIL